ncbi:MAG: metallophosphoesterase [Candidatus Latescibacteria bacterium]|nr:metallophosphoesterase [Candidatus Latescibacterota bacterium]
MKNIQWFILLISIPALIFSQNIPVNIKPQDFTFIVLGDRTGGAEQEIFEQVIASARALNPDFIINVGDLIEGYSQIEETIRNQWDSIFINIGDLKEKFLFTPGNHDIWDSLSKAIYLEQTDYPNTYYNFSLGKNHFVVLDNSLQEKVGAPDSLELAWLQSTLSKYKKADNIICFMHRSFWKQAYTNNAPDTFHKLFVKYGVDYVFSGHDHFYCQQIWDGITYTQVGPSGSRLKVYFKEELGAFQHFVKVNVKNNKVQVKLLRADGTEMPADYVTLDNINEIKSIENAVEITRLEIGTSDSISVIVNNISEIPIATNLAWHSDNDLFKIYPSEESIFIESNRSESYPFHAVVDNDNIYPLPRMSFDYPYAGGAKKYNLERMIPIKLTAACYQLNKPLKIDGKLDEKIYKTIKPLSVFGSSDGNVTKTDPWQVWFLYDNTNLYITAEMIDYAPNQIMTTITKRDERVYSDDHINIVLQSIPESDMYYQFFINALGVVMDRSCKMQGKDSKRDTKWDSNIITHAIINSSGWTVEIAMPLQDFPGFNAEVWGFNLVRFQSGKNTVSTYSVPFEHNPKTFAKLRFTK